MEHSREADQRARRAIALGALVLALVVAVGSPVVVWVQGGGCAGTVIQFTSLDNLLRTAWEYLTSGRVIRTMAPAVRSSPAGVAGMIGRRPSVAVIGLLAGAWLRPSSRRSSARWISQNTATALQICG